MLHLNLFILFELKEFLTENQPFMVEKRGLIPL